ncbi:MAG: TonB-dependent receptor [Carboxylicivirga sp.]|jgi:hypothetical protein|nr:TonB-dependent receptor [Carboxylicivirga sp.]
MKHLFKISCLACLFMVSGRLLAQSYTLSGLIKDFETGETLIGATVYESKSGKGAISNEYGFYSLSLPQGEYELRVSFIGYGDVKLKINLRANRRKDVYMVPVNKYMDQVVVTAKDPLASFTKNTLMGVNNLKPKDIESLPALLGEPDVTRLILTQPGVSTVGEGTSGFNVRGGNIDQNLILLDEAPIYNSSHIWGFFSVFNADAIKDMKLYRGGIPARYGGRASSVLDVRQREGSNRSYKGRGGIGLLFSRLTLEGPIKQDKMSFLVSGRRSHFDLAFPLIESLKSNKVRFYDLNVKLSWNVNENNRLYASGYFGADVFKLKFEDEFDSQDDQNIDFQWENATSTLRWNHIFSDKHFMNLSGIYSQYDYTLSSENSRGPASDLSGNFTWKSAIQNWIVKSDFIFYKNTNTTFRYGVSANLYRFTPSNISSNDEGINHLKFDTENVLEIAPYTSLEKNWNKWSLNAGLRYSWFGNMGEQEIAVYAPGQPKTEDSSMGTKKFGSYELIKAYHNLEPRFAVKYSLNDRKVIKLGYNRNFQYIHLISNTNAALPFDVWKPAGYHIKPLEVNQLALGYAYDTRTDSYNFSVEAYYKRMNNMLEYKNGADLFLNETLETQLLNAKGYSYGIELGMYKNKGKLTGNTNYTYSVTRRRTTGASDEDNINNGEYYPSNFDRPHMFNMTCNYALSKKWRAGIFFTYQTGRPTTHVTGKFTIDGVDYFTYSNRNQFRLGNVHRLDLSFTYQPKVNTTHRWQGSWAFGVYNVYGNKNPFSSYSAIRDGRLRTFQFSVIGSQVPFITYNFKF